MKPGSRKAKSIKSNLKARMESRNMALAGCRRTRRRSRCSGRRHQRGGYSQYQNNMPMTPTYSVGGILPASQLALANSLLIQVLPKCQNCVDNYNYYTNMGSLQEIIKYFYVINKII
jgi:hypothetical protein